ncbi:hypothetical protein C8Q80DRAFT_1337305, partial [Daedaleopsis nitida]
MCLSVTTTATAVASQRLPATPSLPHGYAQYKQLTLRLDPQTHSPCSSQRVAMARKTRLAPIARLPVELLSYIFLLGAHTPDSDRLSEDECDPDQEHNDNISPCLQSSGTSPDVLAAVNRHWREVAIGTPQLWTRICVTIGDVMRGGAPFSVVSRYVSRSGKCPLDIYIDGRDPDWDFSETDSVGAVISPYIDELYDYTHPFRVEHMHHVLNILIPHVRRFRSLAVLTDRWAPMQTALDCLSMEIPAFVSAPRPLPSSLPLLESLVLMRCNEFVSYHSEFSPADQKDPGFLPFSALLRDADDPASEPVLPGLKKLVLSGVHTEWSALPRLLPPPQSPSPSPLETLDMSYHCTEVRPSERDFRALLARCPKLRTLSLRVSGPRSPDSADTCSTAQGASPVPLPHLERVTLGYDDPYAAAAVLDLLAAPGVAQLTLEDAS